MSDEFRLSSTSALNPLDATNWSGKRQESDGERAKRRLMAPEEEEEEPEDKAEKAPPEEEVGGIIDVSA